MKKLTMFATAFAVVAAFSGLQARAQEFGSKELIAAVPSYLPPPSSAADGEEILTISHVSKTYRHFGLLRRSRRTRLGDSRV